MRAAARVVVAVLVVVLGLPSTTAAQSNFARPALDWKTLSTRYFDVYYPRRMTEWARDLASRLDAVHDAVSAFVGFAPRRRVTVIVEDPLSQSNGFANAPMNDPLIVFWPTPPEPSGMLGSYRDWPELLAVHEYAHIAHLVRPSRDPRERWLWRILPVRIGPVARRAPRWAIEGYATFVEGRLTGSGRPHGAARAAYLRQWALEGRLPTYGELSSSREFAGGAMAYLAGSAFLEWLAAQRGDSSLVAVWRRLSARQPRSFAQAFAGVYGAPPDELYGRFTVDVTHRALAARDSLARVGLDTGTIVQRRRWSTGEPAVSRDGARIAIALPNRTTPGPVVVWRTHEPVDTARERRLRARLRALDPDDVPAVAGEPRPRRPVATLRPRDGRAFRQPRFFADTEHVLVVHDEPLGDGAYRADLWEWNIRTGALRRVTHRAAIADADPLPDGTAAIGVRCENGLCDLVRVDLASGAVSVIRRSTPSTPFARPRVAPDGQSVVVAVLDRGRWRVARVPLDPTFADGDAMLAFVDPDDGANRYDPVFLPDGGAFVCVSDASGVPNLERIDLATGRSEPLTRLVSAAFAPAPIPQDSAVLFLALHARGLDLRRAALAPVPGPAVRLPSSLAPAVPRPVERVDTFPRAPLPDARAYGAGPHQHRLLPAGAYAADGGFATLSLFGIDPVGRFAYTLTGGLGERSAWRGASLTASWRGSRSIMPGVMSLDGTLFRAEQRPSAQRAWNGGVSAVRRTLDAVYTGATLGTTSARDYGLARLQLRVGGTIGTVTRPATGDAVRGLAFGEVRGAMRLRRDGYRADLALGVHASHGATDGLGWARAIATLSTDVATPWGGGRIEALLGGSDHGGGVFERFAIGGWPSPFVDASALSQRIAMPALPVGFSIGSRVATVRASMPFGPVRPFYWVGTTHEQFDRWARVAGVDATVVGDAFPAFAIPAITARFGAAYSWDAPFRHRVGVYAGLSYRP